MLPRSIILLFGLFASIAFGQSTSPFASGVWSGNVSGTSASVVVRLTSSGIKVRLAVSTSEALVNPVYSAPANTAATAGNTLTLTVSGLTPDTDYYYGVEVAGILRAEPVSRGQFHTFPLGRASFRIAFGGDSDFRDSNQTAYAAIRAQKPLLFIHEGDLHYIDTNTTNPDDYRQNYDSVLNQPEAGQFFRSMPIAYVWDDHDYCGNDSDGTAVGRDTARSVYKERVPHYPIAPAGGTIAQSFTIGRVRIIMTDLRSAASSASAKESATKTKLGAAQKAWFKQELISARDGGFPLILWVCSNPWICAPQLGEDSWGGYATERTELANFIRDNRVGNVVLLSADMHALAFDDGTHSDFATGGGAPLTVLHASALNAPGSVKGGPYTGGAIAGSQQFGILEVYDTGGPSIACRFLGLKAGETDRPKLSYIFSTTISSGGDHALGNISSLARLSSGDDSLASGFVISGRTSRTVLVRAVGPSLAEFGVSDVLARPQLAVFQGDRQIASNDGWAAAGQDVLSAAFDRAGAFRLMNTTSSDAALLLTLDPGAYTVQVKSGDGKAGATLIEVYDLP
jgi:phosphodiesterase/alkaline phosphatase D-like protein